jgi:hypothetical protein
MLDSIRHLLHSILLVEMITSRQVRVRFQRLIGNWLRTDQRLVVQHEASDPSVLATLVSIPEASARIAQAVYNDAVCVLLASQLAAVQSPQAALPASTVNAVIQASPLHAMANLVIACGGSTQVTILDGGSGDLSAVVACLHVRFKDVLLDSVARGCLLAWTCLERWHQQHSNTALLATAVVQLHALVEYPSVVAQLGSAAWRTFFKPFLAELVGVNEKIGKFLKERLCQKHLGLTDLELVDCLEQLLQLLQLFETGLSSTEGPDLETSLQLLREREATVAHVTAFTPLCQELSQTPLARLDTLQLHTTVTMVMTLITAYSMKSSRAITLLDAETRQNLFGPLEQPIGNESPIAQGIYEQRRAWCTRALGTTLSHPERVRWEPLMDQLLTRLPCAASQQAHDLFVDHRHVRNWLQLSEDAAAVDLWLGLGDTTALMDMVYTVCLQRLSAIVHRDTDGEGAGLLARLPTDLAESILTPPEQQKGDCDVTGAELEPTLQLLSSLAEMEGETGSKANRLLQALG